jgi:hypothetical protein
MLAAQALVGAITYATLLPAMRRMMRRAPNQRLQVALGAAEEDLFFSALIWSGALFSAAAIIPFIFFKPFEKWSRVWMGWALFEIFQGLFLIWASDHIWPREMSGWSPLILAFLKLPAILMLQSRLRGRSERNAVLAFHGGALLFYVSAIPVMLLEQGWLTDPGLDTLLWLTGACNMRDYDGSCTMAPCGSFFCLLK